jgi:hypothetical protein
MRVDETLVAIAGIVVLIGIFIFAMYATGKVIFHMFKLVTNVTGTYASLFGAFLLFMPSQFNKEGNAHRVILLRWLPWVAISYAVLFRLKYVIGIVK